MKLFLTLFFTGILSFINLAEATPNKKVLISQVIEHPALDATTQGIIDGLAEAGYKKGETLDIRVESAQANGALAGQIASKFVTQDPSIVVGVGTLTAQSFAKYASEGKVKLVFATVTDPLGAGLVKSLKNPGNNTSGVSNFVSLGPQLSLFKKLQPNLKKIGILYNSGEVNSIHIVKQLEDLCPKLGLTLIKQTVSKTADVSQAATKLAQNVDAILISNDNTALGALPNIIKAAQNAKIPVYVSDTDAVEQGALAALGPNQYEVGKQAGKMVVRILQGADINSQPVEFPSKTELYINLDTASQIGLSIPKDVLKKASKVISSKKP